LLETPVAGFIKKAQRLLFLSQLLSKSGRAQRGGPYAPERGLYLLHDLSELGLR